MLKCCRRYRAVSYTHLDVYKRQVNKIVQWESHILLKRWRLELQYIQTKDDTAESCSIPKSSFLQEVNSQLLHGKWKMISTNHSRSKENIDDFLLVTMSVSTDGEKYLSFAKHAETLWLRSSLFFTALSHDIHGLQ